MSATPQRARRLRSRAATTLAFAAALCAAGPAGAAAVEFTPITEPASGEHHVGKVVWEELVAPDLEPEMHFYSGLFGWTFRRIADAAPTGDAPAAAPDAAPGPSHYALALLDGRPVAGIFQRAPRPGTHPRAAWLNFLAVRDVDAAVQAAVTGGARLLAPARTYARRGRQAVLADPQGAVFAVIDTMGGDPPDYLAEPGEWIWNSLIVRDPDTDAAFYQLLFGYEAYDLAREDGLEHVVLSSEDMARASINALAPQAAMPAGAATAGAPAPHGHWLAFIRVTDIGTTVSRAVALGGAIAVPPHPDHHGGQVAIVTDPAGALVGLMEWSVAPQPGQVP